VILRALRIAGQVRKAWAQVERPDLARLAADGHVVIVFSDIEGSTEQNQALGDRGWVKVLEGLA
jgi:adenylate cyclase